MKKLIYRQSKALNYYGITDRRLEYVVAYFQEQLTEHPDAILRIESYHDYHDGTTTEVEISWPVEETDEAFEKRKKVEAKRAAKELIEKEQAKQKKLEKEQRLYLRLKEKYELPASSTER